MFYEQVWEEARETAAEAGTEGSLPSHAHLCTTGHYAEYIAKNLQQLKLRSYCLEMLYSEAIQTVYLKKSIFFMEIWLILRLIFCNILHFFAACGFCAADREAPTRGACSTEGQSGIPNLIKSTNFALCVTKELFI